MSQPTLSSWRIFVMLTGGLLAGSGAARGSTILSAPTTFTQCGSGQLGLDEGTGPCSQSSANGSDSISLSLLPYAGLSANASVAGFVTDSYSGFATLDYSFEVVGGNPGDQVPLLIFSNLLTSIGGDAYAFSEIVVSSNSNPIGNVVACQSYGGNCPGNAPANFSGSLDLDVSSGAIEDIHLEIEATTNPVLGASTSSASADPLIEIDPGFADAADYSIVQSQGVGNGTASLPEPGTLILICGPFLLLARRYIS